MLEVRRIDVGASGRVRVTFSNGTTTIRRTNRKFGIAEPAGAAALAKFVAKHRLGHVRRVFQFLMALPETYRGVLPLPLIGDCR